MFVQANLLDELVLLASLGDRDTTGIEESLETTIAPGPNGLI